jgi:hypothetical protein
VGGEGYEALVKYLRVASWVLAVWLLGVALWELRRNWQGNEIASHSDEAAHFVTGMMVYDYVRGHLGENPLAFAEQYYARYPKVALGHWPPGYYLLQAVGAGVWQAHALNWLLALGFVLAWWRALRGVLGAALALGSGAWLLSLPVLHRCAELVLSDWGAVLCTWIAGAIWVSGRPTLWLVAVASLAILTKGNAWMILPALAFAPVLCGEWRKLPWRACLGICVLSAPFYFWVKANGFSYPLRNATEVNFLEAIPKRWKLMSDIWAAAPLPIWALALVGLIVGAFFAQGIVRRWWAYSVSFVGATLMFLLASGLSYEDRAVALALPFLCVLALMPALLWPSKIGPVMLVLLCLPRGEIGVVAVKGFRGVADSLPAQTPSVLVVSDSIGEGAMVAHVLEGDARREKVVLRGSRMLSQQGWDGRSQTMRFGRSEELRAALDAIPVQVVLLDSVNTLPYAAQIRELSKGWNLLERRRSGSRILELFAIPENVGKPIRPFRMELGLERGGRAIVFRPGPL